VIKNKIYQETDINEEARQVNARCSNEAAAGTQQGHTCLLRYEGHVVATQAPSVPQTHDHVFADDGILRPLTRSHGRRTSFTAISQDGGKHANHFELQVLPYDACMRI
jgi:hypothetical protein